MTRHHIPEEALLSYAAGTATEGESILIASHCTLCPSCRSQVRHFEQVAGAALADLAPAAVPEGMLDALFAAMDLPSAPVERNPLPVGDGILPNAVAAYTGPLAKVAWVALIPGVEVFPLAAVHNDIPVRLFRLAPGMRVPLHAHDGTERVMVLTGSFSDECGEFRRGDVSWRDDDGDHDQLMGPEEPCVALVVADGMLVPRSAEAELIAGLV